MKTKKIFLQLIFCSLHIFTSSSAQKIYLPDSHWRDFLLTTSASACITGDSLDTACPALSSITNLNCSWRSITNLTGLNYFPNLEILDCSNNLIQQIVILPASLKNLNCSYNLLTHEYDIVNWVTQIEELDCSHNQLNGSLFTNSSMPFLKTLNVSNNNLRYINQIAQSYPLSYIDCSNNPFLDSICPLPSTLKTLKCSGIQLISPFPDSLADLEIISARIQTLPPLPTNLTHLTIISSPSTSASISNFPNLLTYIILKGDSLSILPPLPPNLIQLEVNDNLLNSLPNLPPALNYIDLRNNLLDTLPTLPLTLKHLDIGLNPFRSFPILNDSVVDLSIDQTLITQIDSFPSSIRSINVASDSIPIIPTLPPNLNLLNMSNSKISSLPYIPNSLHFLIASNSSLLNLNNLPNSMEYLFLNSCPISCLPPIQFCSNILLSNSNIHCLPNIIYTLLNNTVNLPLCQPSNGCEISWNISGTIYNDINSNCLQDSLENLIYNVPVKLDSAGVTTQVCYSNSFGEYSFRASLGSYTLVIDTAVFPITNCTGNAIIPVTLTTQDSLIDSLDFGLICDSTFDLVARSINISNRFRPGRTASIILNAGEREQLFGMKCYSDSATIRVAINGPVTSVLPVPGALVPDSINLTDIMWRVPDLATLSTPSNFQLNLQFDQSSTLGDSVCFDLSISPTIDDDSTNNFIHVCIPIVNSFDPNEKSVFPQVADTSLHEFTYTVFFQNTGTAEAENIYILDTLDNDLDPSTFEFIAASHPVITQVLPGNALRFNFPNINLIDSTANEQLSHGFCKYKVKRKSSTGSGTIISNTAYIYFDYNPPIATNTTTTEIEVIIIISSPKEQVQVSISPNPAKDEIHISVGENKITNVKIFNTLGTILLDKKVQSNSAMTLNTFGLPRGIAIIELTTPSGLFRGKVILN